MTAITFDTLKYANTLEAAGVPRQQAAAQAEALSDILEVNLKELATKGDIVTVQKDITTMEQRLKSEFKADLRETELRMTIKLGGMMAAFISLAVAAIKLL